LAVDNSGNVYVTGFSEGLDSTFDYATIKYDSLGNQLWVIRYDGPGNRGGGANSLLVDNSGNVYVTGVSYGSSTNFDYATIKYDSRGNELWVVHYNGPGDGEDVAKFLVHDGSGNIYVTGSSEGSGTGCYDYATIKYDSSGNQLWVARYDGGGSEDEVYSMAVDNSGNVYVTGQTGYRLPDSSWNCDYATVKYDSSGNQLWAARYNGPGNYWDGARSLAVDNSGNVYVTGLSTGSGTYFDYATIKYDSLGNQLWVTRYDGPGNHMDGARSIAVDNAGNVYVTGESDASITNSDYATIKYGPDGQ